MKPATPSTDDINRTLCEIERTELPEEHPRRLAREVIARWKSNAEREGLPVVNPTTGSGAPLLDKDRVVRGSYPSYRGGLVEGRSWWRRLIGR